MPVAADIMTPLWRGVVVLRLITAVFAAGSIVLHHGGYVRPSLGWVVFAGILIWTVLTSLAYSHEPTRRVRVLLIDLLITLILMGSSALVLSPSQLTEPAERTPLLTTVWASGPVVAAAVHAGWPAGSLFGAAVAALDVWLRGTFSIDLARDTILLVGTGFVVGLAASAARQASEQLRRAARAEAASAERERLARSIHDSVVQVLARVRARGGELGGEAAELARLAGEQEIALRSLFSAGAPGSSLAGGEEQRDLAAAVRELAGTRVEVSVPATPVPLPAAEVAELVAVAREALTNTARHAGAQTRSWVLVEDLGEQVVLTIRDDGPGIDEQSLADAPGQGRMGVARSIRGRVADLGGTVTLHTAAGQGTQWQVRVRRDPRSTRQVKRAR
jgi:signal transduction histidine kinase